MSVVPPNRSIRFYFDDNKWRLGYESKAAIIDAPAEDALNCLSNIIQECTQLHIDLMQRDEKPEKTCCLCGSEYVGFGHNPEPLKSYPARCCDSCNSNKVIPARIDRIFNRNRER